jgi:hypothetical protein
MLKGCGNPGTETENKTINIGKCRHRTLHCKKRLAILPSPAGMSFTKLSLAWNNLISPDQGEFGK